MSRRRVRTTDEIIDETIRENRFGEYLLYTLATLFVVGGLALVLGAFFRGRESFGLAGGAATVLFFPAMRQAEKIRKMNIAIRLLEIPLKHSKTAEEAATILQNFFLVQSMDRTFDRREAVRPDVRRDDV